MFGNLTGTKEGFIPPCARSNPNESCFCAQPQGRAFQSTSGQKESAREKKRHQIEASNFKFIEASTWRSRVPIKAL